MAFSVKPSQRGENILYVQLVIGAVESEEVRRVGLARLFGFAGLKSVDDKHRALVADERGYVVGPAGGGGAVRMQDERDFARAWQPDARDPILHGGAAQRDRVARTSRERNIARLFGAKSQP